ncbi:MAG: arylsulfatase [Cyclobacteriaceae bacterium]
MKYSILCLSFMLLTDCIQGRHPETARPNVIIILTDDQGWGDLSMSGNKNLHTPNIDLLAEKGARFKHFYVSPVCSPTRAEILTGRYHPRGGVYSTSAGGERLDLDETTIAQIFKEAGYTTAAFGKWHNGMQYPYHPNARGFDEFYGFCSGHWGDYFSPLLEHNGKLVKGEGFIIDDLTEKAMEYMESNKENPFFLYLPYNTPHSPMQVPDRWWNKFKDNEIEMLYHGAEKEDLQFTKAALAMCENIDWNVGRVVEKIKELNLTENTIVIYLSDNGPNGWRWNGGMKGKKGSTDEGGVRSPAIICWPGKIKPGKEIKEIASAIDLLPTLAGLTGIDYSASKPLDGVSLKSLLLEERTEWNDRLVFNYWNGSISVRSQQYRLDSYGKLFDMENDPGQSNDISNQRPEIVAELRKAAEKWNKEVASELPKKEIRSFSLGHPGAKYTQLPARDGVAHGSIERSNQFPNSSFFTHWISVDDSITWNIDVMGSGDFEVVLYYTCPKKDIGSSFELSLGNNRLIGKVTKAHDPPLRGMEHDRVERSESYVKDFIPLKLGILHLEKGSGQLTLKALEIPGSQVMDFRLLMFTSVMVD